MKSTRAPLQISDEIVALCESIASASSPVFVPIKPAPTAEADECFNVVGTRVKNNGGQMILGWQIWETPGVILEAEFHAVWQHPKGKWLDLTPKRVKTHQTLFLPDPGKQYDGRQVRPVLRPLTELTELRDWMSACDAYFKFLNRGARAEQLAISIPSSEQAEFFQIKRRMAETQQALELTIERSNDRRSFSGA